MSNVKLNEVIKLAGKIKKIIISTASPAGLPHFTMAGSVTYVSKSQVIISEWFCPETLKNLQNNRHIAILIWDQNNGKGYQLLGKVNRVESKSFLDGYVAGEEEIQPPRIESKLTVDITRMMDFKTEYHKDL